MSADADRWPDQLEIAVYTIAAAFEVAAMVTVDRQSEPWTYPAYGPTPTCTHDVARRALAGLLNSGWRPPPEVKR